MLRKKRILNLTLLILFLCASTNSFCQSQLEKVTKTFDKIVGEENLSINNGVFNLRDLYYVDPDRTKYFVSNEYSIGDVAYDGQYYYDVKLKYDLYKGLLIYNPINSGPNIGCNLIQPKVDSFSLHTKKFILLDKPELAGTSMHTGYYQKLKIAKNFVLYIKYHKTRSDKIKKDKIVYFYTPDYKFWLKYKNDYIAISSKKDISAVFPDFSKNISQFYDTQGFIKKSDPPLFHQKLMVYINNLLEN